MSYLRILSEPLLDSGSYRFKNEISMDPVSAGAGLAGSLLSYFGNKANTKATNDLTYKMFKEGNEFTAEQSALAFQREYDAAKEFFNMENAYNTPLEQVKRLQEAGINPSVAMAGSLGSAMSTPGNASAPTGKAGSSVGVPSLQTPPQFPNLGMQAMQGMQAFSEVLKNVSNSKFMNAQTKSVYDKLTAEIDNLVSSTNKNNADADMQRTMKEYQDYQNHLQSVFGYEKAAKEVQKLGNEVALLSAEAELARLKGDTEKAQKLYTDALTDLTRSKDKEIQVQLPYLANFLKARIDNLKASTAESYSNIEVNNERKKVFSETASQIHEITRGLRNDNDVKEWTKSEQFGNVLQDLENKKIIAEEMRERIKKLAREGNWYDLQQCMGVIESVTRSVGNVMPGTVKTGDSTHKVYYNKNGEISGYSTVTNQYSYD